jgi:hypothetical protein
MKQQLVERRFDFRAGLNEKVQRNLLNRNELVLSENVRLEDRQGSVQARTGSRRLHETALPGPVVGVTQWDAPGGKQLVAIADGDLFHKTTQYGDFTSVSPSPAIGSIPTSFATHRANAVNAPLRLYLADGNRVWRWTGSALTGISGTSNVPVNVDLIRTYNVRSFWRRADHEQSIYWGVLGDPEDGTTGLGDLGGAAMVDVLRGEGITAIEVIGSSLLIATPKSVVRFSGYSASDIQIAQDTQGISSEVGCVGPLALLRAEEIAIMFSERDVYVLNEAELKAIGTKVKPIFQRMQRDQMGSVCLGYHPLRREVWVAYAAEGDTGQQSVMVYSSELDAWSGPFHYPFAINCFSLYEDADGDEYLVAGCSDGFVRDMDIGHLDDVLADGSGGQDFTSVLEFPPAVFESGPHMLKTLQRLNLQHKVPEGGRVRIGISVDEEAHEWRWKTLLGRGHGDLEDTRIDFYAQGKRVHLRLELDGPVRKEILGFTLQAFDMQRNV